MKRGIDRIPRPGVEFDFESCEEITDAFEEIGTGVIEFHGPEFEEPSFGDFLWDEVVLGGLFQAEAEPVITISACEICVEVALDISLYATAQGKGPRVCYRFDECKEEDEFPQPPTPPKPPPPPPRDRTPPPKKVGAGSPLCGGLLTLHATRKAFTYADFGDVVYESPGTQIPTHSRGVTKDSVIFTGFNVLSTENFYLATYFNTVINPPDPITMEQAREQFRIYSEEENGRFSNQYLCAVIFTDQYTRQGPTEILGGQVIDRGWFPQYKVWDDHEYVLECGVKKKAPPPDNNNDNDDMNCCKNQRDNDALLKKIFRELVKARKDVQEVEKDVVLARRAVNDVADDVVLVGEAVGVVKECVLLTGEAVGVVKECVLVVGVVVGTIEEDVEGLKEAIEGVGEDVKGVGEAVEKTEKVIKEVEGDVKEVGEAVEKTEKVIKEVEGDVKEVGEAIEVTKEIIEEAGEVIKNVGETIGIEDFPVIAPAYLTEDGSAREIRSIPQFQQYIIEQLDALFGAFPIDIEIEDTDPTQSGNQKAEVKIPNLAEGLAEIYGLLTKTAVDSDVSLNFLTRLAFELESVKAATLLAQSYARGNAAYLGYQGNLEEFKIQNFFNIDADEIEDFTDILKEKKVSVRTWVNEDKNTVQGYLERLMFAASIIKEVHVKNDGNRTAGKMINLVGDALIHGFGSKEWKDFLEYLNTEGFVGRTPSSPQPSAKNIDLTRREPESGEQ